MSYSIGEAILDQTLHAKFLQAVLEQYPDATKYENRWFSNALEVADCDDIRGDEQQIRLCKKVAGGHVFPRGASCTLDVLVYAPPKGPGAPRRSPSPS